MTCNYHLCHKPLEGRQRKYCCSSCKTKDFITKKRRSIKQELINIKGGGCQKCGYNKCPSALQFHHLQPEEKLFGLAESGHYRSFDKALAEADKCILVCANCHAELEHEKYNIPR